MTIWHPFTLLNESSVGWFAALLVLVLVFAAAEYATGAPLQRATGQGIIALELAGTVERTRQILSAWEQKDVNSRTLATVNVAFDYPFLAAYSTCLALACSFAGQAFSSVSSPLATWAPVMAWLAWTAGACDAVEDFGLLQSIQGPVVSPWPQLSASFAYAKFGLIILTFLYSLAGAIAWLLQRL